MSKCPFWSTKNNTVMCHEGCPMLLGEDGIQLSADQCVFQTETVEDEYSEREPLYSTYDDDYDTDYNYALRKVEPWY